MDKKTLRAEIRAKKRAMTAQEIEEKSAALAKAFYETAEYKNAKTIYGYLPYNQEVRTTQMLAHALADGKQVAVPKVYGDEMKFILLSDLGQVAKGYAGIPEPIADGPVAADPTALVLMPGLPLTRRATGWATAAGSMINSWLPSRTTPLWPCAMIFRCCPIWTRKAMIFPWTGSCGRKSASQNKGEKEI